MVKIVKETYFCDICGEEIVGRFKPVERATKEIGYWGEYNYQELEEPQFHIKNFDLCELCKEHSANHLVAMITSLWSGYVEYGWLKGQKVEEKNNE